MQRNYWVFAVLSCIQIRIDTHTVSKFGCDSRRTADSALCTDCLWNARFERGNQNKLQTAHFIDITFCDEFYRDFHVRFTLIYSLFCTQLGLISLIKILRGLVMIRMCPTLCYVNTVSHQTHLNCVNNRWFCANNNSVWCFDRLIGIKLHSRMMMAWEIIWVLIRTMHARQVNHVQPRARMDFAGITKIVNCLTQMNSIWMVSNTQWVVNSSVERKLLSVENHNPKKSHDQPAKLIWLCVWIA